MAQFPIRNRKIRIGIIGANFAAKVHAPAFQLNPHCEIIAIASKNPTNASQAAKKLNIPTVYNSWEELIAAKDIDAISIAVAPHIQHKIASQAIANSKAILIEKPMATTLADAKQMYLAAKNATIPNMIDFPFCYLEPWIEAKQRIMQQQLGKLRHMVVTFNVETRANINSNEFATNWKVEHELGGGTLFNFASHVLHYIEWFSGPLMNINCSLYNNVNHSKSKNDTFVAITGQFTSGAAVNISVSTAAFMGLGHKIEFYGDSGSMILQNQTTDYMQGFSLQIATRDNPLWQTINVPEQNTNYEDSRILPVSRIVNQFVNWIQTGKQTNNPTYPTFYDGLRVQTLLDSAIKSNESHSGIVF